MLKVGELAALANLTVRTLHHYDSIGLLQPSARSDAGYRLYDRDDVARLHQIQALRAFGMSLADIGLYLDSPEGSPLAVVERQLAALDRQLRETARVRDQLLRLRGQLASGAMPDLSTWLTTLEQTMDIMSVYEKYFTPEELEKLSMVRDDAVKAQWRALVEQAGGLMASQVPPAAEAAKVFALRWLQTFERDTGGDPALASKLNVMAQQEQEAVGIPGPVMGYVMQAVAELGLRQLAVASLELLAAAARARIVAADLHAHVGGVVVGAPAVVPAVTAWGASRSSGAADGLKSACW
jgi:DNA-binding transcriptional MerR regulator